LYAAPEAMIVDGALQPHGSQSDIFSLGLVLMEMLWAKGAHRDIRLHHYVCEVTNEDVKQYHAHLALLYLVPFKDLFCTFILVSLIKPMLEAERGKRPRAKEVLQQIKAFQMSTEDCPCHRKWKEII
jgi:hypothetical protein